MVCGMPIRVAGWSDHNAVNCSGLSYDKAVNTRRNLKLY